MQPRRLAIRWSGAHRARHARDGNVGPSDLGFGCGARLRARLAFAGIVELACARLRDPVPAPPRLH
jgi:hypothetical protein